MEGRVGWLNTISPSAGLGAIVRKQKKKDQDKRRREMTFEQFQASVGQSGFDRDKAIYLAKQSIGVAEQVAHEQTSLITGRQQHEMELTRIKAEAASALGMRRADVGIETGAHAARLANITGARAISGYGRESQIEDVNRQIGMREALLKAGAGGHFRQQVIDAQLAESEKQQQFHGQRLGQARGLEQKALADVASAEKKNLPWEEQNRLTDIATAAAEHRKAAQEALTQAEQRSIEPRKQGEANILQTLQQQGDVLKNNLSTIKGQIQAERMRKQGLQESLGLMNPMKLRTALGISRKLKAGMPVQQRELEFMQGMPGVFGTQLQKIGAANAAHGPSAQMIRELMQNTGQGKREQELHRQETKLALAIENKIVIDEKSLTQQIAEKLVGPINQAIAQLEQKYKDGMAKVGNQARGQQRAAFGGQ